MRRGAISAAVLPAALLLLAASTPAQQTASPGFTGAPGLVRAYDAVFDARFDEVPALLREACGPAPSEACRLVEALALWWRIQLDPRSTAHDAAFQETVETAIAAAEAWTRREPQRAESWFYLGASYGARVQWRSLRSERLAAARDGVRIKNALEQALALDPQMHDAWFGIGLYHYYADVAPAALRILRWLLLLPGGDREAGLQEMIRARTHGQLVRSEADYQLHLVYLWYERQPRRAIELLMELQRRHPANPHFVQATAEVQDVYLGDAAASLRTWESLLDAARSGRLQQPSLAVTAARLGAALQLARLGRTDAAIDHLRRVIARNAPAPYGAVAQAHLQLGDVLARTGRASDAIDEYRAAIASAPPRDPAGIASQANTRLRELR